MHRFVHGTTYYHFANPEVELDENFRKMREMGINAVRVAEIWPGWEVLEPAPGVFDFCELDSYLSKARDAGLEVIMGIGINNPPFWVFEDIADVRCVDVSGKKAVRRVQSANHDNPGYRRVMERFIGKMAGRYGAAAGVAAWQFGNEIRYGVDLADNECTRKRFRQWLRDGFEGQLDELNRRWGTRYRSWDGIYPYCSPGGAPTSGLSPLAIASRKFQAWSIEELVRWGVGIIRRYSELPIFHNNFGISGVNGSHWKISSACDLVVQDIYPSSAADPRTYNCFLLECAASAARSQEKHFWVGETSIGQYGTFHRDRPAPESIETLVIEMLGAGAKGILYFRHKAPKYEQPHKFTGSQAAFRRDGTALEYANTVKNVDKLVSGFGERILKANPLFPRTGIYYPGESVLFSGTAGYGSLQVDACFGADGLWNRLGYPVHMLTAEELTEKGGRGFDLIYLPLSYLLPREVGNSLKKYVSEGGVLVSEVRPGYVDGDGWMYEKQPGAGLDRVFGAGEDVFWNAPSMGVESEFASAAFTGAFQTFLPAGGEVFARNEKGEAVAVRNEFGRGKAFIFGFAPSLLFPAGKGKYDSGGAAPPPISLQADALVFMEKFLSRIGHTSPVPLSPPHRGMSVRCLESDDEILVFVMNYGPPGALPVPEGFSVLCCADDFRGGKTAESATVLDSNSWVILTGRPHG